MAISTAPGSEVRRPLATVVIGGLVTATLLTMFLLPVIYGMFGRAMDAHANRLNGRFDGRGEPIA